MEGQERVSADENESSVSHWQYFQPAVCLGQQDFGV
jgi:hypothetical protein